MGQTISQKLSLYEVLTMLAIGTLLMPLLLILCGLTSLIEMTNPFFWIIGYCIGLILHRTLEFFRNIFTPKSWKSTKNPAPCSHFFHTIFCRNYPPIIDDCQYDEKHPNKDYYEKYYQVKNSNYSSSISSLEAQEAFLRDLSWVEIIYLIVLPFADVTNINICQCGCSCSVSTVGMLLANKSLCLIVLGIILLLTFLGRYITQRKIYELIQESCYFVSNNIVENTVSCNQDKDSKDIENKCNNKIWITVSNQPDFSTLKISDPANDAITDNNLWFYECERKEAEEFLRLLKQTIYYNYKHRKSAEWLTKAWIEKN